MCPSSAHTPSLMNEVLAELDVRAPVGGPGGLHRRRYRPNLAATRSWLRGNRLPRGAIRPGRRTGTGGEIVRDALYSQRAKIEVCAAIVWAELVWNLVIQ